MQQQRQFMNALKNWYCDFVQSALTEKEFADCYQGENLTDEQVRTLCEQVVKENIKNGIVEINLKTSKVQVAKEVLDNFGVQGKVVVDEKYLENLTTKDFLEDKIIIEITDILDLTPQRLSEISDLCAKMKVPILIHFARSLDEVGLINVRYNLSPAKLLEDFGFLDRECILLGCNYLDKDDLELLSTYQVKIVLTPKTDALKARGFVNLLSIENSGVEYGFATESYPKYNLFEEAFISYANTANLILEKEPISLKKLLASLQSKNGKIEFCKNIASQPLVALEIEQSQILRVELNNKNLYIKEGE